MAATVHVNMLVACVVTLIYYSNGAVCKPNYLKQTSFCASYTDNEILLATDSNVTGMLIGSDMEFLHHHLH